jgi:hypothetical protein
MKRFKALRDERSSPLLRAGRLAGVPEETSTEGDDASHLSSSKPLGSLQVGQLGGGTPASTEPVQERARNSFQVISAGLPRAKPALRNAS